MIYDFSLCISLLPSQESYEKFDFPYKNCNLIIYRLITAVADKMVLNWTWPLGKKIKQVKDSQENV